MAARSHAWRAEPAERPCRSSAPFFLSSPPKACDSRGHVRCMRLGRRWEMVGDGGEIACLRLEGTAEEPIALGCAVEAVEHLGDT